VVREAYRERRIAAQDGLALYYRDYGDPNAGDTPVLCLGGLTRNSKDAHTVALRLSQRRRVLCPDYRGRGKSAYDPNPANYRPEIYGSDAIQVLDAANVHKVVVIGTSLGGLLGMALGHGGAALAAPFVEARAGVRFESVGLLAGEPLLLLALAGVGCLAGIVPAMRAYRVDVAESLE